jgi:hypothetical protein
VVDLSMSFVVALGWHIEYIYLAIFIFGFSSFKGELCSGETSLCQLQ